MEIELILKTLLRSFSVTFVNKTNNDLLVHLMNEPVHTYIHTGSHYRINRRITNERSELHDSIYVKVVLMTICNSGDRFNSGESLTIFTKYLRSAVFYSD